jgi:hypothetical protein
MKSSAVCRLGGAETEPSSEVFSSFDKHFKNMLQNCTRKFQQIYETGENEEPENIRPTHERKRKC